MNIIHLYKRYRSLQTNRIQALPIVILMPHSACNCRCVMCDIWKGNDRLEQLNENDIRGLLDDFKKLDVKNVVMSGGEALLNPNFFRFCELLQPLGIRVTLLSTGITLAHHAQNLVRYVQDIIVSLDGDEALHDEIRNIRGAFLKIKKGIEAIRALNPDFKITGRSVIHKMNYLFWPRIIEAARNLGLNQISFLPADVSSHAFNREVLWSDARQHELLLNTDDVDQLRKIAQQIIADNATDFKSGFIAESPEKILKIVDYYGWFCGSNPLPSHDCNAPWVSAVIEADGNVRPCFFFESTGNIRQQSFDSIINSKDQIAFRKQLNTREHDTCKKCVCYLNLRPGEMVN